MRPSPRACDSSTNSKSEVGDKLDNYDILREIGRGSTSTVRLAISKKGRLKGRQMAIKEIALHLTADHDSAESASTTGTATIHQALHHPSVVSCLSAFSTPSVSYHVLEYCARGNLWDFLFLRYKSSSRLLSEESEVRGLLKNVVDALVYLEKESVVHRDVAPKNVFVTEDYRVKLGGFESAIRLNSGDSTTTEAFNGNPDYMSPEIASNVPYGFSTDLWSLGCLVLTCMTGKPPFEAASTQKTSVRMRNASYEVPETVSFDLKDLISGFLQIIPEHRTPLHRIASHPFFHPALPIRTFNPSQLSSRLSVNSKRSEDHPIAKRQWRDRNLEKDPALEGGKKIGLGKPFGDITNLHQRLHAEAQVGHRTHHNFSTRRVASDPVTGTNARTKFLDAERVKVRFRSRSVVATSPFSARSGVTDNDKNLESSDNKVERLSMQSGSPEDFGDPPSPVGHPISSTPRLSIPLNPDTNRKRVFPLEFLKDEVVPLSQPNRCEGGRSPGQAPIGVTRPVPLNTLCLVPQTQKVNRGQLIILSSRSLLVDFREGERRQGRPGTEVLLINHDGSSVYIYSAPHLSSPCCLAEPIAEYSLIDLPFTYWKQYNDAGRIVEQIKQHVPKLVMYDVGIKCTLMANEPEADVELLFYTLKDGKADPGPKSECQTPNMRIRLLRRRQLVEISQRVLSAGEEWTKKVLVVPGGDFSVVDQGTLETEETNGLARAIAFVSVCEIFESQTKKAVVRPPRKPPSPRPSTTPVDVGSAEDVSAAPASLLTGTLSHFDIAPRPPKFSSLDQVVNQHEFTNSCYEGFETRFIPSVGWCVRYCSSGHAGKYKMMFFDGAILEVDVDGECVEFVDSVTEEVVRHNIRDCSSKRNVMERMKAFKEFVSLFDDDDDDDSGSVLS